MHISAICARRPTDEGLWTQVEVKEKEKKRGKKQVQMTTKVVTGEVTGDFAYVGSIIYYAVCF